MEHIDPEEPMYELFVDGKKVATLCAPRWEDMFWCSYQIKPTDADAELVIRNTNTWETVNFTVRDSRGGIPNQHTFSGGYTDFCDGKTDRLTFRSLSPPQSTRANVALNWLKQKLSRFVYWLLQPVEKQPKNVK
ncbi:MAG TPA: hypothetical protein DDZ51_20995 [Planctomycetaceae bacterium]|nr:hypothetical protein [Planctomycetaceae bacterium]